jgi:hypothetical protein
MIRNRDLKSNIFYTLLAAIVLHAAILAFVKIDLHNSEMLEALTRISKTNTRPIKLDKIDFINQSAVEKMRRVGIKNGKKDLQRPDMPIQRPRPTPPPAKTQKGSTTGAPALSLDKLAPDLPKPEMIKKPTEPQTPKPQNQMAQKFLNSAPSTEPGHFYFNPKVEKVIQRSNEQEILKNQAAKNFTAPQNKATDRISNFEIRYERPEGVSEDELNSDEKAYYSFYVRSYQNYFSKIYSNYEKIVVQKPGLAKVFDKKHLLIGKIDYDENGNIVTVKIIKSSEDDDLHYFFEETLKQLNQPNPPKIFTKNRKQFSIYYQLQIN